MSNVKDTGSLLRDWRYVIGAVAALFLVAFVVNYAGATNAIKRELADKQFEKEVAAALANNEKPPAAAAPSAFADAVSHTLGSLYGFVELFNIVALVAVASLLAFYALKLFYPSSLAKIGDEFDEGWAGMSKPERTRWKIGVWCLILFGILAGRSHGATNYALPISDKAIDLIVHYEVGGESYYKRRLSGPTVPAWKTTVSGVTVGFGVDVGHMTNAQIRTAFDGIIPGHMIRSLQSVSGLKGSSAYYNGLPRVKHTVRVTWEQAKDVFERDTLPRYTELTRKAFNLDPERLHPHENGALVSLVFNRGSSMSQRSSRNEMRYIRRDIGRGYAGYVPGHIRSMKRLWSYSRLKGLHLRRDAESYLFAEGSRARIQGF